MNRFVLDCSITMAWCFEEEHSAYAAALLHRLETEEAIVPSLWSIEVANVLWVGERRKRITPADSTRFVSLLNGLPIRFDPETSSRVLPDILPVARSHAISVYDATYLELAMRRGLPLATLDERLRRIALSIGITLLRR